MILTLGAGGMSEAFEGIKVPQSQCDVRRPRDIACALEQYRPSVLILTAGVSNPDIIEWCRYEDEINTNLLGAFNVAQMATIYQVPMLIFISSVAGLYGKPNHSAYCATKAGVISLVQSLAMEGHQAYAVSPGRVNTPMRDKDYPNDTEGSRLEPVHVWNVIQEIINGIYESGSNIMIRKQGLIEIIKKVVPTPMRDELRVGQPVTI